jgi:PAS domain S-box-containing protein
MSLEVVILILGLLFGALLLCGLVLRARGRRALEESEARFKAQYKGLPIPVYTWQKKNDDFELVDFNQAAEEITDGGIGRFLGVTTSEMFRDDPDVRKEMWECFEKKGFLERDMLYQFKSTVKTRQLHVSYCYVPPDMVLVHTQDVTDHTEAEEKLRESEARLRTAIDSIPFDLFMIGEEGRYVMQNAALREHWGADIVGKRPEDLGVDEETLALWRDNNRRAFAGEVVADEVSFDVRGEERHFYNIVSPVSDGSRIRGVLGVNVDITALKRAEKELSESHGQLRALAGRLHEVREEESTTIAREIHDELGQVLAVLKWELSSVEGKLGAVLDAGGRLQLRDKIIDMTRRVDDTIRTVKRISSQLRPVMLDELGLAGAIAWYVREFRSRTGIHCEIDQSGIDKGGLTLDAQRSTAAFRIFQEILTNVLRHAEAGHVRIDLRREDDVVTLEVQDDGKGMPPGVDAQRTGLGILGMRERAQVFGGEVSFGSESGKGTRVRVVIPVGGEKARDPEA